MDLYAYCQIGELEELAKKNGIEVPRLRGYRLMKDEKPITAEDWKEIRHDTEIDVMKNLCQSNWGRDKYGYWITDYTRAKCAYHIKNYECQYMSKDDEGYKEPEIRWDRLKGKKKRIFITRVKNALRDYKKQYGVWNKYCGRDDILYIHARIGGGNWAYYCDQVVDKPWFLEKVDDAWDGTYCDIYAKIKAGDDS